MIKVLSPGTNEECFQFCTFSGFEGFDEVDIWVLHVEDHDVLVSFGWFDSASLVGGNGAFAEVDPEVEKMGGHWMDAKSVTGGGGSVGFLFVGLVERMFCCCWAMWPLMVDEKVVVK